MADKNELRGGQTLSLVDKLREADGALAALYPTPNIPVDDPWTKVSHSSVLKRETRFGTAFVRITTASIAADDERLEYVDLWFVDPLFRDNDLMWAVGREDFDALSRVPDIESSRRLERLHEHMSALLAGEFEPVRSHQEFPRVTA